MKQSTVFRHRGYSFRRVMVAGSLTIIYRIKDRAGQRVAVALSQSEARHKIDKLCEASNVVV